MNYFYSKKYDSIMKYVFIFSIYLYVLGILMDNLVGIVSVDSLTISLIVF